MNKKIIFLFVLFAIELSKGLKSTDLCISSKEKCSGSLDSKKNYQIECKQTCEGNFSYDCDYQICTTNAINCKGYTQILQFYKAFQKAMVYKIDLEKINIFKKSIIKCPIIAPASAKWKLSDICLNVINCQQRLQISMSGSLVKYNKKLDCPCDGYQSYQCGRDYCTSSRQVCESTASYRNQKSKFLPINNCASKPLTSESSSLEENNLI